MVILNVLWIGYSVDNPSTAATTRRIDLVFCGLFVCELLVFVSSYGELISQTVFSCMGVLMGLRRVLVLCTVTAVAVGDRRGGR